MITIFNLVIVAAAVCAVQTWHTLVLNRSLELIRFFLANPINKQLLGGCVGGLIVKFVLAIAFLMSSVLFVTFPYEFMD